MKSNIDEIREKINTACDLAEMLDYDQKQHEKDGLYYKTTKILLDSYRELRFDVANSKIIKTVESIDIDTSNLSASLDIILAMPEVYNYYTKEIDSFVTSSSPAKMGLYIHLIDSGLKIMQHAEKKDDPLAYSKIIKALYIDEEIPINDLFEKFKTNKSTFYRKRDEAITALSIAIFGATGYRHPMKNENNVEIEKKYEKYYNELDKIDRYYAKNK